MTRRPSCRPEDAFGFTPEMGQRLRSLRPEAGSRQDGLAFGLAAAFFAAYDRPSNKPQPA